MIVLSSKDRKQYMLPEYYMLPKKISERRPKVNKKKPWGNTSRLADIYDEIHYRLFDIKNHMFVIGDLLTQAKEMVRHGNFKEWIEKHFDFGYQTANNFMNVYRYCLEIPEVVSTIKPSVLYQIASPNFPADLREHLFEHHHELDDIDNKTIREICKKFKEGEIDLDSPEVKSLIQYDEDKVAFAEYFEKAEESLRRLEQFKRGLGKLTWTRPNWQYYLRLWGGYEPKDGEEIPEPPSNWSSDYGRKYEENRIVLLSKEQEERLKKYYKEILQMVNTMFPWAYIVHKDDKIEPEFNEERFGPECGKHSFINPINLWDFQFEEKWEGFVINDVTVDPRKLGFGELDSFIKYTEELDEPEKVEARSKNLFKNNDLLDVKYV